MITSVPVLSHAYLTKCSGSHRAIEFCCEFLVEFASTTDDLTVIANTVYSKTLKDFHSYVVRGAFKVSRCAKSSSLVTRDWTI